MKHLQWEILGSLFFFCSTFGFSQKTISEGTVMYDMEMQSKTGNKSANGLTGSKTTVYLKGGFSRVEMSSPLGTETTLFNAKTGTGAILKEYSGQKLMVTLTKKNWDARNAKYEGIIFEKVNETKVIEGYNCNKAVAKLKDGGMLTVFYTPDLVPMNKEYSQAFKNLPGFPLEYEIETDKSIFKYRVARVDFSPIATTRFDLPKTGYRVMTYDENKSGKQDDN